MNQKNKRFLADLYAATVRGCAIAVCALIVFFLVMKIVAAVNETAIEPGMNFGSLMTIIAFALVISYAKELFRVSSLPAAAQWALNFLIIGIAYFFVVLRSSQFAFKTANAYVAGVVIYIFGYAIAVGIALLIRFLMKRGNKKSSPSKGSTEKKKNSGYTNRFS